MSGDIGPARASGSIEKIFQQIIERCGPATPFQIKLQSLLTMVIALDIIVGSVGSMARRTCVNDFYFWKVFLKQMWERLNPEEQSMMAEHEGFLDQLNRTYLEWEACAVGEVFDFLRGAIQKLRGGRSLEHITSGQEA